MSDRCGKFRAAVFDHRLPPMKRGGRTDGHSVVDAEIQEYANVLASNNCDINALIAFMHKRTKI